jgi:hypothetical protein
MIPTSPETPKASGPEVEEQDLPVDPSELENPEVVEEQRKVFARDREAHRGPDIQGSTAQPTLLLNGQAYVPGPLAKVKRAAAEEEKRSGSIWAQRRAMGGGLFQRVPGAGAPEGA